MVFRQTSPPTSHFLQYSSYSQGLSAEYFTETAQSLPAVGASTGQRSWQHRLSEPSEVVAAPSLVTLKRRSAWLGLGLGIGVGVVMEGSSAAAYQHLHFHLRFRCEHLHEKLLHNLQQARMQGASQVAASRGSIKWNERSRLMACTMFPPGCFPNRPSRWE